MSGRTLRWRLAAVALCAALLADLARADAPRWTGTFANPAQSEAAIDAAIERVVSQMSFFTRSVARAEVKGASPAFTRVEIETAPDAITVTFEARKPVRTPASGDTIRWTRDDGVEFDVHGRLGDDAFRQSFVNGSGTRLNVFTLSPDGRTLNLDVELSSDRLPEPIRYRLTFERVEPDR